MPNTDHINAIIEELRADKAVGTHFRMETFTCLLDSDKVPDGTSLYIYHPCNTALCIAGWANLHRLKVNSPDLLKNSERYIEEISSVVRAGAWLGISWDQRGQRDQLFAMRCATSSVLRVDGINHPLEWFDTLPTEKRYDAAIRVLEILRDTDEVDWRTALIDAGVDLHNDGDSTWRC